MEYGKLILNPRPEDIPQDFGKDRQYGFDTETYGVRTTDRAFSYQLSDGKYTLYFNHKSYPDAPFVDVISYDQTAEVIQPYLKEATHIFIANAKFDMFRLEHIGIDPLKLNIFCNHAMHRLIDNNAVNCKLETQGEYWGYPKDSAVEEYIKKHRLHTPLECFGFDMGKQPHYDKVPFHIIQPYGCRDAWLSYQIGMRQIDKLKNHALLEQETKLIKVLYKMEKRGIRIDLPYVEDRIKYHIKKRREVLEDLGAGFVDGKTFLVPVFNKHSLPITYNRKTGEPLFKSDILEQYKHIPEIKHTLIYRYHHKLLKSFYLKLWLFNEDGIIHTDFNQYAAKTGRMSSRNPSLLNIPSRAGKEVKRAFIPFEDYYFLQLDHSGAELRLTYDIAKQTNMVERFKRGEDMHLSLAKMVNVPRDVAKTVIFALLYGSGVRGISKRINQTYSKAKLTVMRIKKGIPKVWELQDRLKTRLRIHGYIKNLRGRVLYVAREDDYKVLNALIQSSLADIVKEEMLDTDRALDDTYSFLSLSVHDSIIFQIYKDDTYIQDELIDIMENNYISSSGLKLNVTAEHGLKNYGDLEDGIIKVKREYHEKEKSSGTT